MTATNIKSEVNFAACRLWALCAALVACGVQAQGGASAPAASAATAAEPIKQAAWMAGCWALQGAEAGSVEQWTAPAVGTMLGVSRTVRGGRLSQFEFMMLRTTGDGRLIFVALPGGRNETEFALRSASPDELVFESPRASFPRRVLYRRSGTQQMLGRIEGEANGEARAVDFPYVRAACP